MPEPLKVFVSHHRSNDDDALTMRLVSDLRAAGVDVWVDTERIPSGDFVRKINEGLKGRQYLILVMTPGALASPWVQMEVNAALTAMNAGRMLGVIPIVMKPCDELDIPPLWSTLQRYDATHDYASCVGLLFYALGIYVTPPRPPASANPQSQPATGAQSQAITPSGSSSAANYSDPTSFGSFADFFETLFGERRSANDTDARDARRSADLRYDLTITFEEAVLGCQKEIEIPRLETCSDCKGSGAQPGATLERCDTCEGTGVVQSIYQSIYPQDKQQARALTCWRCKGNGRVITKPCKRCEGRGQVRLVRRLTVNIPAGVDDGTHLRVTGAGDAPEHGGTPGNLYVALRVEPHAIFKRQGIDITLELSVHSAVARQGGEVKVPTIGGNVIMTIPPGTTNGRVFRLKGKGAPVPHQQTRGDELVTIKVAP